jgi:hypothetical protein
MKTYSTVVSGREMSKFIQIPDEFRELSIPGTIIIERRRPNVAISLEMIEDGNKLKFEVRH